MELARPLSSKGDGACLTGGDLHVEQLKVLALKVPSRTPPQGVSPSEGLTVQVWRQITGKQLDIEYILSVDMDELGNRQIGIWIFG